AAAKTQLAPSADAKAADATGELRPATSSGQGIKPTVVKTSGTDVTAVPTSLPQEATPAKPKLKPSAEPAAPTGPSPEKPQ
ncbi:MAG: hypothetical protein ABJA69_09415, partial [Acidobacteriaceae bacterium]